MADGSGSEQRVSGWVRAAGALAALAVTLIVALALLIHHMDDQAARIGEDLDQGRLRQYGVVAR